MSRALRIGGAVEGEARADRPWLLITVLTAIYVFAFIDRSVITLLVDPIKQDLQLDDIQVSLLMGLAFSLAYSAMNLPAGFIIDRVGRRGVIGGAAAGWSLMTIACGVAGGYGQMLVARIGLGAAEAFVTPASFSLVRDRVAPQGRGRAFSYLGMAPYIGAAVAFVGGAAILQAAQSGSFAGLPLIGGLAPWQTVFVVTGTVSLLAASLIFLLRPDTERQPRSGPDGASLTQVLQYLRLNAKTYAALLGFSTAFALFAFGTSSWTPAMMNRKFGLPLSEVGYYFGYISLIAGVSGLLAGGFLIDRLNASGRSLLLLGIPGMGLAGCSAVLMPLVPNPGLAWLMSGFTGMLSAPSFAIGATLLAKLTPPRMMGIVTALYFLCQSVIGAGLGPTAVAVISSAFFTGPAAIAPAISVYAAITAICAVILLSALRNVSSGADLFRAGHHA